MDEIITNTDTYYNDIKTTAVALNLDKKIYLIRAFEEDTTLRKKYIRNVAIFVDNILLTSIFADTVHFFEELNLFDLGNDQNKYFSVVTQNNTKNLKLNVGDKNIYISKSEAKAMYKLFNIAFQGYSTARALEFEYRFTQDNIASLLFENENIVSIK